MSTKTTNYNLIKQNGEDYVGYDDLSNNFDIIDDVLKSNADNIKSRSKTATYEAYTMRAAVWSSGSYSFESDYPKASCDIEIAASDQMTAAELKAFNKAMVTGSTTTNVIKALGTVPTIDIPVIIRKVAK